MNNDYPRKPEWLRIKLPSAGEYSYIKKYLDQFKLHTICESGSCPNQAECWGQKTATFMILGDICTRSCKFCNVKSGSPEKIDAEEPEKVANAILALNLKHCVITSVTRDDLEDGGAGIWSDTVNAVRKINPETTIETLIPDFQGKLENLRKLIDSKPEIISHNLETVERLTKQVRNKASYNVSLEVIKCISRAGIISKSGIMLGLGETENEIIETMDDLLEAGCQIFTIGQYLQPSKRNIPVYEYVEPERFHKYREIALTKGFKYAESGPLIRSSYNSHNQWMSLSQ